jgi:hypothetical protein
VAVEDVVRLAEGDRAAVVALLERFGVTLVEVSGAAEPIPYTFWGEPEAGISGTRLYARADTPLHSILHELCHIVCMSAARRAGLRRHAGGTALEECAVCYLQIVLSDYVPRYGRAACMADMDAWGYSFREGSTAAWFAGDGVFAAEWLRAKTLIDADGRPRWALRA